MKPTDTVSTATQVTMTKGYKSTQGVIAYPTDSKFDLYVIKLNTGMKIVAGPSAFEINKE